MKIIRCLCHCHDTDGVVQFYGVDCRDRLEELLACPLCQADHIRAPKQLPPSAPWVDDLN